MYYFFHFDGQTYGPLYEDQIRYLIEKGIVTVQTLAWTEGMDSWRQVQELPDLLQSYPILLGIEETFEEDDSSGGGGESLSQSQASLIERLPNQAAQGQSAQNISQRNIQGHPQGRTYPEERSIPKQTVPKTAPASDPQGVMADIQAFSPFAELYAAPLQTIGRTLRHVYNRTMDMRGKKAAAYDENGAEDINSSESLEPITVTYSLANFRDRTLASMIDTAIWVFIFVALLLTFTDPSNPLYTTQDGIWRPIKGWMDGITYLGMAIYYVFLMSDYGGGQSVGYKLMNLKLVDEVHGQPPTLTKTILWYLFTWISTIGWIWYFVDKKRRMLHNLASKTVVVRLPDEDES